MFWRVPFGGRSGCWVRFSVNSTPPPCGCCGSPCPVSREYDAEPHYTFDFLCLVCEADAIGAPNETPSDGTVYRHWDGTGWQVYDGSWGSLRSAFPSTDPHEAVDTGFMAAAGHSPRRSGPGGRGLTRCRNPHRYAPARCGAGTGRDLRNTRAWRELVDQLQRAGLLDVPRRLATYRPIDSVTGEQLEETCYLTGRLASFKQPHEKSMELCVFQTHGSGGILSVDVFDGTVRFETTFRRDAAAGRELLAQWRERSADPVLEGAACVALHTAFWRHDVADLTRAHLWLSVALIEDPQLRAQGVALARTGKHRGPSELRSALADVCGDEDLLLEPPRQASEDRLATSTRSVWDVWLFENGPFG